MFRNNSKLYKNSVFRADSKEKNSTHACSRYNTVGQRRLFLPSEDFLLAPNRSAYFVVLLWNNVIRKRVL